MCPVNGFGSGVEQSSDSRPPHTIKKWTDTMTSASILVKHQQWVRTLTLNRPEQRNALSDDVLDGLKSELDAAEADPSVRIVILTGAGKSFCAGGNIKGHKERAETTRSITGIRDYYLTRGVRIAERLLSYPKPILAAVNGAAAGAGMQLALFCDLRIVSEDAFFVAPFTGLGLSPDWFATQLLPQYVGLGRASELLLTGRRLGAADALDWGLVNEVHPRGSLLARAEALAIELASRPPVALSVTKRMLRSWSAAHQGVGTEMEALALAFCQMTDDHAEAIQAFSEKRVGNYEGK
jgi:enoyl-CoA hydratase/carnithine racemase